MRDSEIIMNATQQLHELVQSLWLDNITHSLLTSGTLDRYIREIAVTGLTSNPTICDHASKKDDFSDDAIRRRCIASGQLEGAAAFAKSWNDLTRRIASKRGLP